MWVIFLRMCRFPVTWGGWLRVVARLGVVLWLCGRCFLCSGLEEDGCEDVNSVVISKRFLFCHGKIA